MRTRGRPFVDQRHAPSALFVAKETHADLVEKARLISKMISRWRGRMRWNSSSGQVSSASGSRVWLV
jgi:hypothetical protein